MLVMSSILAPKCARVYSSLLFFQIKEMGKKRKSGSLYLCEWILSARENGGRQAVAKVEQRSFLPTAALYFIFFGT